MPDKCANCGQVIGNLEKAFVFRDKPVCIACYGRLTGKKAGTPWVAILATLLLVFGCIAGWAVWKLIWQSGSQSVVVNQPAPPSPTSPAPAAKTALPQLLNRPTPPPAPATIVAAPGPAKIPTGSITGSVWLNKQDGTSNIQRGRQIGLLRPFVSGTAIAACLEITAKRWDKAAADDEKQAADLRKSQDEFNRSIAEFHGTPDDSDPGKADADAALEDQAHAMKARSIAMTLPAKIQTGDAYKLVAENSQFGLAPFSDAISEAMIQAATTDVAGKYEIDAVPEGDYFVSAAIGNDAGFVEWVLPVHVTAGAAAKVDLFNDDAATISVH